jgi:hypothetical protein
MFFKEIFLLDFFRFYEDQSDFVNAAKAYEAYLTLYTEELVSCVYQNL